MIIEVVGKEIEKIKGDFESYLNGLNMVGEISYSQYSELYDEGTKQIQKAYELGKSELEKENAELRKEWHYMKDVNCYEDLPQNKDVYYAYVVNVGAYDKPTIERKLGCFAEFEFDVMAYHVIAWKEIVLPKLKESK